MVEQTAHLMVVRTDCQSAEKLDVTKAARKVVSKGGKKDTSWMVGYLVAQTAEKRAARWVDWMEP